MESIIDFIDIACLFPDVDSWLQLSGVVGKVGHTYVVIISFILGMLYSHPFGYGNVAYIRRLGMLGLGYILLTLEKISTHALRRSQSYLPNLTLKGLLVSSSPLLHMNC
jgi:hypothetical protein